MNFAPEKMKDLSEEEVIDITRIHAEISAFPRPANLLVMTLDHDGDETGPETRYGGRPWMSPDAAWPQYDGRQMIFVAQINLDDVPGTEARETVLVFVAEEGYEEGKTSVAILTPPGAGVLRDDGPSDPYEPVRLHAATDYPHSEDLDELLSDAVREAWNDGIWEGSVRSAHWHTEIDDATGEEVNHNDLVRKGLTARVPCFTSDKVGGWPHWLQASEVPEDAAEEPMTFVAQFSDMGRLGNESVDGKSSVWGGVYVFASADFSEVFVVQQAD